MPSIRCSSPTAWRPVSSIPASASRSRSRAGSAPSSRRTPPACSTITETLWATASCSSRAIRARSSTTAARACSSRSSSTRTTWRSAAARRSSWARTIRPDAPRQQVEAGLGDRLGDLLDPAGAEVDDHVREPDAVAGERGLEAQLVGDREHQDQLGEERRQRVGVVGRVVRDRLRDRDGGQGGERRAAAERDRRAVDGGGDQPALGVLACESLEHAEDQDRQRDREVDDLGAADSHGGGNLPALRGGFIVCADDRRVPRAGDLESPGRATTPDATGRSLRPHALQPPPLLSNHRRAGADPRADPHRRRNARDAVGGRGHHRQLPRRARRRSRAGGARRHAPALRLPAAASGRARHHAPRSPLHAQARAHRWSARRSGSRHAAGPARDRLLRPGSGAGAPALAVGRDRRRRRLQLGRDRDASRRRSRRCSSVS